MSRIREKDIIILMNIEQIDSYFHNLIPIDSFKKNDRALNGLQVGSKSGEVNRLACAVDASMESIKRAAQWGADMLFVHHGFFWGEHKPITGYLFDRIAFLTENNIALYALHLPLDCDPEIGNNISLARAAGLNNLLPFGEYRGMKIAYKGNFSKPVTVEEVLENLGYKPADMLSILKFGPEKCETGAAISGGGGDEAEQAIDEHIDLYITGEISHQIYHSCLESKINVVAAGHYLTETYGVKNVAAKVKEQLGIETCFIDVPTGL